MRAYPRNSPHAAARILALMLLADGHVCRAELDALLDEGSSWWPALPAPELRALLQDLTEDLLATGAGPWTRPEGIDADLVSTLFDEVDDPDLRDHILTRCVDLAGADGHLSDGESALLGALHRHWGLDRSAA